MSVTVKGSNTLQEQPKRRRWTRLNGWVTVRSWAGPAALVAAKEQELVDEYRTKAANDDPSGPLSIDTREDPVSEVSVEYPTDGGSSGYIDSETPVVELVPMEIEKDIETAAIFNPSASSAKILLQIDAALRSGTAQETDWDSVFGGTSYNAYLQHRSSGVDTYLTFGYMIRKSWATRSFGEAKLSSTGVGTIYTYQNVLKELGVTAPWNQPTVSVSSGGSAANPEFSALALDQWLKKAPSRRVQARNVQIVQEWFGAQRWSKQLYSGGTWDLKGS